MSSRVTGLRCVCGVVIDDASAGDLLAAVEQHLRESHAARSSESSTAEGGNNVAQQNDIAITRASSPATDQGRNER